MSDKTWRVCRVCRGTIATMAFRGTGYCCELCVKADRSEHEHYRRRWLVGGVR